MSMWHYHHRRHPFSNYWDHAPMDLFDQDFGMPMWPTTRPMVPTFHPYWMAPPRTQGSTDERGVSRVVNDDKRFAISLDVRHFKPDEIKVKTVGDVIEIEGKHEEQSDEHGSISRHFVRKYKLPADVEPGSVQSNLTPDGMLTVECPKKAKIESSKERQVPITMSPQPEAIKSAPKRHKLEEK